MPLAVIINPILIAPVISVNFTLLALLDHVADDGTRDSAGHGALDGIIAGGSADGRTADPADQRPAANTVRGTSAQQNGRRQAQYGDFHDYVFHGVSFSSEGEPGALSTRLVASTVVKGSFFFDRGHTARL